MSHRHSRRFLTGHTGRARRHLAISLAVAAGILPALAADQLLGVSARSASNLWAVGTYFDGTTEQPLAIHCC